MPTRSIRAGLQTSITFKDARAFRVGEVHKLIFIFTVPAYLHDVAIDPYVEKIGHWQSGAPEDARGSAERRIGGNRDFAADHENWK